MLFLIYLEQATADMKLAAHTLSSPASSQGCHQTEVRWAGACAPLPPRGRKQESLISDE